MANVIKPIEPIVTTQMERRCSQTLGINNLDLPMSADLTIDQLSQKFGVVMTLWDEPQDSNGNQTGPRVKVPDRAIPMDEVLQREFTAAGVTLSGAVILALYNEIIDTYKGN